MRAVLVYLTYFLGQIVFTCIVDPSGGTIGYSAYSWFMTWSVEFDKTELLWKTPDPNWLDELED